MTYNSQYHMDDLDWSILEQIDRDARLSLSEIGRRVNLSQPAVAERVRRLEDAGIIRGYHADINVASVGLPVTAFIRVRSTVNSKLEEHIKENQAIKEGYRITGDDCVLLKVQVSSNEELGVILEKLSSFGITSTSVVLSPIVERRACSRPE